MQPQNRKVLVMLAVSMGIITFSFLLPLVIIPAYLDISNASSCATSIGCSQDSYSRCGAYESSGDSGSFTDSISRGMKGMLCLMGFDNGDAKITSPLVSRSGHITLNKVLLPIV
ncbi:MAG: hypothetical protein ACREAZ_09700 [Nitrososphaera sp.]